METKFISGQRWFSETEPELGLGSVVAADTRHVRLYFPSSNVTRDYACDSAPLRRVRFAVGDRVLSNDGRIIEVKEVVDENGVLAYHGSGGAISEPDLSETMDFSSSEDRLLIGKVDSNSLFDLRFLAHEKRAWLDSLPVHGFLGARISLLPHQLFIAYEMSRRYQVRVLLGDEVGLGKTIEAGLILHRQILTGQCTRVLILLPESLKHQWFLELWRRFNLKCSVFDEDRCIAIETGEPNENPFLDSSLVISSLEFLTSDRNRAEQVCDAGWDMLVVDEAHHLKWHPAEPSLSYQLVQKLAGSIPSVLLLSGSPEQLGEEGHFARLQLLDPERFHDLEQFQREQDRYLTVASVVDKLLDESPLNRKEQEILSEIYHYDPAKLKNQFQTIRKGDEKAREALITEFVDRHGTSRLFYRNQRDSITGFPMRLLELHGLGLDEHCIKLYGGEAPSTETIFPEFQVSLDRWKEWWKYDPRVKVVIKLLERFPYEKMLLICARGETAQGLQEAIESSTGMPLAVFHEDLPLMVRDRQAAYFADPDGARLLICSEIGSEGRNFQFCHHLILFDLPENPELLEQRIGRLDRIGQKSDVHIHVLYLKQTPQEVLARWYDDGLDAFRQPLQGAGKLYAEFGNRVGQLAGNWFVEHDYNKIKALIKDTRKAKKRVIRKLSKGRDRLLEWHSYRPDIGNALVETIDLIESCPDLASFMEDLCQYLGVRVEDHDHNSLFVLPGDQYKGLPGLSGTGMVVTFSRQRALAREDIPFLSWEHPMFIGGMDQLLGSPDGKTAYGVWEDPSSRSILLETIFLVSCLAPKQLRPERFLPLTPLRILMNHLEMISLMTWNMSN